MKTLILTLEYPPQVGGIASYVYNLASHLPAQDTLVYCPKVKNGANFDKNNSWITYRQNPYGFWYWPRWLKMLWQVIKIIKKENIDRLYIQQVLPVGYVAYLLKKFKKIPYVIFLHGTDIEYAYRLSKRSKFKSVCQAASSIVVNSQFLKTKLESRVDKLPEIKVVYPCPGDIFFSNENILTEAEKLKSRLALSGKKIILSVGRLTDGKGFPHLIRILPQVLKLVPNAVLVIVGDGPKLNSLMQLIQKLSLQNVVRLVGSQPYSLMPSYYSVADVFALLTHPDQEAEEGWGTVFVEAAASGLPVVAGRSGGSEEAIENGVSGRVINVYEESGVVSAIVELLNNPALAKQMGEAGRNRALNEFRWGKQIAKL